LFVIINSLREHREGRVTASNAVTLTQEKFFAKFVSMECTNVGPGSDDASLVRAIVAAAPGVDRNAEAEICRRLAPRVRLFGLRHLRDAQAAADLAQQVLLMVIEKLRAGALREPDKLTSYVLGMSRLTVLDLRRNASRRDALLRQYGDIADAVIPAEINEPDRARLSRCMKRLSERARSVLVLSFFGDKGAGEIGRELGMSPENTRVIRHRALAQLRDCMGAAGEGAR
jgi:RNA polymerase sigma-70 factor, ECF subfamily